MGVSAVRYLFSPFIVSLWQSIFFFFFALNLQYINENSKCRKSTPQSNAVSVRCVSSAHLPKLIHLSLQFKPLLEAVAALICLRVLAESVSLSVTFVPNCVALHPS